MTPFLAVSGWLWLLTNLIVPSWEQLEAKLPKAPHPLCFANSLPNDASQNQKIVLFRDKEAICPFSEQVWLALEVKNLDYVTVLVDTTIQENSWSSPLKVLWPDGSTQTNSLDILEKLEQEYPGEDTGKNGPNLYPTLSMAVDSVRCNIVRFQGVFPRNIQPNPYAPYLIRQKSPDERAIWVPESDHMVTLEETDEVLEEYYQGPFLCGKDITAADLIWAPFLERYAAQLPLIYEGDNLTPRSSEYESLKKWYEAMEEKVPAYSCRVMGDMATWQRLLQTGVEQGLTPKVDLLPPRSKAIPTNRRKFDADAVWSQYISTRPHVAASPELECAAFYIRNRESVIDQASSKLTNMSVDEIEQALREILAALSASSSGENDVSGLSGNSRELASFLDSILSVPRDMGLLPAATLRNLVAAAPKPRIASR